MLDGLGAARSSQQHVRRLDVAVHESLFVRRVQGGRDLTEDPDRPCGLQRSLLVKQRPKIRALHEPHRDEQVSARGACFVDRDHVGVIERGGEPRLADESLAEPLVIGQLRSQDLQRDLPLEPVVLGQVDHAHAAATQGADDAVAGDLRAGLQVQAARSDGLPRGFAEAERRIAPEDLLVEALELP